MWSTKAKGIITLICCVLIAISLGDIIGSGEYDKIILLSYAVIGLFATSVSGYAPLIAFGILNPFILPLPYVRAFPFLALMLGVCTLKFIIKESVTHVESRGYRRCITFAFGAFFAWVLFRYALKPVRPNFSGIGVNITGFRSYLNYALCFGVLVMLPFFIRRRDDALNLIRWILWISAFFILLLLPLTFTKSGTVAMWLQAFGLFVTSFGNGWLRFVVLPGFGLSLIVICLLPSLVPMSRMWRIALVLLGMIAVGFGGNRSTAAMAVVAVVSILALKRNYRALITMMALAAAALGVGYVLGEGGHLSADMPLARIVAMVSPRMAFETGAEGTTLWREVRRNRAFEEIKQNPILGKGYGGLENAWAFGTMDEFDEASLDIDLATGGIHNGFLASAYSLGIPATILFLLAFGLQLSRSACGAIKWARSDPVIRDFHCFAFANLAPLLIGIYIGSDLNAPMIWLYLALSVVFSNLPVGTQAITESKATVTPAAPRQTLPGGHAPGLVRPWAT